MSEENDTVRFCFFLDIEWRSIELFFDDCDWPEKFSEKETHYFLIRSFYSRSTKIFEPLFIELAISCPFSIFSLLLPKFSERKNTWTKRMRNVQLYDHRSNISTNFWIFMNHEFRNAKAALARITVVVLPDFLKEDHYFSDLKLSPISLWIIIHNKTRLPSFDGSVFVQCHRAEVKKVR